MRLGLLTKMILFILVPAVLGLVLLAGISYKMSENTLREQIDTDMKLEHFTLEMIHIHSF